MNKKVILQQRHEDIVAGILEEHLPQNEVWAFGSRAGGLPKPHSDLDLVIVDPPLVPESVFARLKVSFEESDLPFRVDVVVLSQLEPGFQDAVKREHVAFKKPHQASPQASPQ